MPTSAQKTPSTRADASLITVLFPLSVYCTFYEYMLYYKMVICMKNSIKILCIGNSFSQDTIFLAPAVARALGLKTVHFGNLFIGGCPISRHWQNLQEDAPAYLYTDSHGGEWESHPEFKISDAIALDQWDYISIQHGSSFGSSYIQEQCYSELPALTKAVRELAGPHAKIVFNMTWTGEPEHDHRDMLHFNRDQNALFSAICQITERLAAPYVDQVIPTGTAIQNARTAGLGYPLCRDGYHLSKDVGRYLASLTFLCALTGISPCTVAADPNIKGQAVLAKAAALAIEQPYSTSRVIEHMYLYETHLHTAPVSKCGKVGVRENLEFYKSAGYAGVFITNHFIDGNINIDKSLPYEELIEFYCSDYEEAVKIGKELGISVFFGIESSYRGTDFLIYGLDKAWLLQHPEIRDMKKSEQLRFFMEQGALVIQAHPFLEASYIDHIRLFPRCVHGVEVFNACRSDFDNKMARHYADAYNLIHFAGTDNHRGGDRRTLGGMQTAVPVESEQHFVQLVLNGQAGIYQFEKELEK